MKGKTVLITGAAGFIGANLANKLFKDNEVHLFIKKETKDWRIKEILPQLNTHEVDLNDQRQVDQKLFTIKPQVIFHLATYSSYRSQTNLEEMIRTNIIYTVNLLMGTEKIAFESFVNVGSSSEYGFKTKPMKETDLLEPISFYAATKASATLLSHVFSLNSKGAIVTVRPFSVYGYFENPTRLIPTVIKAALRNQEINLTDGDEKRDFIFIEDMVEALITASETKNTNGQVFNAGTGKQYSTREVVEKIIKLTNSKSKVNFGAYPNRLWDTDFWVADTNKAKKLLDWEAENSLEEGLQKSINWFKDNLEFYP